MKAAIVVLVLAAASSAVAADAGPCDAQPGYSCIPDSPVPDAFYLNYPDIGLPKVDVSPSSPAPIPLPYEGCSCASSPDDRQGWTLLLILATLFFCRWGE